MHFNLEKLSPRRHVHAGNRVNCCSLTQSKGSSRRRWNLLVDLEFRDILHINSLRSLSIRSDG